jgi:hypothetical protein
MGAGVEAVTGGVLTSFVLVLAVLAGCWTLLWALGGVLAWIAGDDGDE